MAYAFELESLDDKKIALNVLVQVKLYRCTAWTENICRVK